MFLLTILAIMFMLLIVTVVGGISLFGSIGIVVFGDVIICAGAIALIIYLIIKKKRKR